jgi:hypothetical protein
MPSDPNRAVAAAGRAATEEPVEPLPARDAVSQYLATIGRRGGIKGGKARAGALSQSKRKAIAKKAAEARWANRGKA